MALSYDRLREVLHYDGDTGTFTWLVSISNRVQVGGVAGCPQSAGYILIGIDGERFLAHQLAVYYMTGTMPAGQVDHKNRVPHDNRWGNLRAATIGQNRANTKRRSDNSSGFKGVQFHPQTGKWRPRIKVAGRSISLGLFHNPQDAHCAYVEAAQKHYGEFARAA